VAARLLAGARWIGRWGVASGAGLAAAGLAVEILSILAIAPWIMEQRAYVTEDRAIAPFSLHRADGTALTSQSLRGHVAVLAFWATWCGPCQGELPELAAIARRYGGDARVMFLAVNPLREGDTPAKALAYLHAHRIGLPVAMDDTPAAAIAIGGTAQTDQGEGAQSLGLASLPAIYVLDPAGRLVTAHHGYDGSEGLSRSLAARIGRLLAADANPSRISKS
jgi:thiol-disulfide isomerase/thioredoxin